MVAEESVGSCFVVEKEVMVARVVLVMLGGRES